MKKHRRESLMKLRSICNHKLQNVAAKQNESWIKLVANIKSEYTPWQSTANAAHLSWILVHLVLTQGCRLTSFHHEGLLFATAGRGKWSKSVTSSSYSRVSHVISADMLWPKYMTISKELRGEIPTFVRTEWNQKSRKHPMDYTPFNKMQQYSGFAFPGALKQAEVKSTVTCHYKTRSLRRRKEIPVHWFCRVSRAPSSYS
ncbi:uncharacterized protein LOC116459029 [Hylobates moloch]|uniref:uncharacterized protein LOC116459029 n=1 Tax=Hylobates moloch TaxID=81572 RepID=UPI0013645545|nr:uncharacterized protein LOC116459029 [Hylobates moloch]